RCLVPHHHDPVLPVLVNEWTGVGTLTQRTQHSLGLPDVLRHIETLASEVTCLPDDVPLLFVVVDAPRIDQPSPSVQYARRGQAVVGQQEPEPPFGLGPPQGT